MDFDDIVIYIIAIIGFIGVCLIAVFGIKESIEKNNYEKECERKAILYDYIMEQNGDGE